MNLSNIFRAASGFFFCFYFVFGSNTAQAINIQEALGFYASLSQKAQKAKEKEVFSILENLDDIKPKIEPKNLSEEELRVLVYALDEPTYLIRNAPDWSSRNMDQSFREPTNLILFESDFHRAFFFSRFDLHRNRDDLFTKLFLFTDDEGIKLEDILSLGLFGEPPLFELAFEEAKRNWEDFLGAARRAKQTGLSNLSTIDLEAAAMSFIHQRIPGSYSALRQEDLLNGLLNNPNAWLEDSLGKFFHNRFSIDHYMSPHFTLTPENYYFQHIMAMIADGFFLFRGQNHPLINSKEFVLKIWKDTMKEINLVNMTKSSPVTFLGRIVAESIIECRRQGISLESHSFLKHMAEAAREDDRLAEFMGIVYNLVSRTNLESYWRSLQNFGWRSLQDFGIPESETDWMIFNFLSYPDLEDFVLQHSGPIDPADAGTRL